MKSFKLLFIAFLFLCCTYVQINAQAPPTVYPEVYAVDAIEGYTTYRIFAEMYNENDYCFAITGHEFSPLTMGGSSDEVWNHSGGTVVGSGLNTVFCEFDPQICYDSFLTIGNIDGYFFDGTEIPCITQVYVAAASGSFDMSLGTAIGPNLLINDGACFTTQGCFSPPNGNGYGHGPSNKILLAQITIPNDDQLEYNLNLAFYPGDDDTYLTHYYGLPGAAESENDGGYDGSIHGLHWPYGNCTDPLACNYNESPLEPNLDFSCTYNCPGCTDSTACNFNQEATEDDGSCLVTCLGCMDSSADNYVWFATMDDGSCEYWGCTDSSAENYDATANVDDGTCIILGCTVAWAENYDPLATVNDESCDIKLTGYVFLDYDESGSFNIGDVPLPNQRVWLNPGMKEVITNDNGYYQFSGLGSEDYTLEIAQDLISQIATTATSFNIENPTLTSPDVIQMGFVNNNIITDFDFNILASTRNYPCEGGEILHEIYLRNNGQFAQSGVVELTIDPLLTSYIEITSFDSIVDNHVYFSYDDLTPGKTINYLFNLLVPDNLEIDQNITSDVSVYRWIGDFLALQSSTSFNMPVSCDWSQNPKTVTPFGWDEERFILVDTSLEHAIRFSNDTEETISKVAYLDSIDTWLDMSTFELITNSHSVLTHLNHEERTIRFEMNNVGLTPADSDFEESLGRIAFRMLPYADTPPGQVIESQGNLYFNNELATNINPDWNTIFECGTESNISLDSDTACLGSSFSLAALGVFLWESNWFINDELVSTETQFEFTPETTGEFTLQLTSSNAYCSSDTSITLFVYEMPSINITQDGTLLTATEAAAWQWYFNADPIDGATDQSFNFTEAGNYSVLAFFDNGCTAFSDVIIITSVLELDRAKVSVFPNPTSGEINFDLPPGTYAWSIKDLSGREIVNEGNIPGGRHTIDLSRFSQGTYSLEIINQHQLYSSALIFLE
jgi:hypothetical protein